MRVSAGISLANGGEERQAQKEVDGRETYRQRDRQISKQAQINRGKQNNKHADYVADLLAA